MTTYYISLLKQMAFLVLAGFLLSCKKLINVDAPKNQIITSVVFADSADATAAILGMYVKIMNASTIVNFGNGGITIHTGLAADELNQTGTDVTESQFYSNSISPVDNSVNDLMWKMAYQLIYQSNACIEGLISSGSLPNSVRNPLLGEAKFMRAFVYFNLVNLYGDVPLILTTNYSASAIERRKITDSIFIQIISDLSDAGQLLSNEYVTTGRVRPNRYTSLALLSRVYLYRKNWAEAEKLASEIISSNKYSLEANLDNVFLASSKEAIWQLKPIQPGFETAEGQRFIPTTSASSRPRYAITNHLLNSFAANDQRKGKWLKSKIVSGQTYNYPYKYKLRNVGNATPVENYMVFRLAEQYLIRSEARAEQNNITGAISDLNHIRNRAGLISLSPSNQNSLLTGIELERRLELFCEWGHRWFDLKRTGKATLLLSGHKADWQATDILFPIPSEELKINPFLHQNAGY